jgi:hypothetical protein
MGDEGERKADDRFDWLRARVTNAFKNLKQDRIDKGLSAQESMYEHCHCLAVCHALLTMTQPVLGHRGVHVSACSSFGSWDFSPLVSNSCCPPRVVCHVHSLLYPSQ